MTDSIFECDDLSPEPVLVLVSDEVLEPEALIPSERVLARMEGITARDRAEAVVLHDSALQVTTIGTDTDEAFAGALLRRVEVALAAIEAKVNPFTSLANKLHKSLTTWRAENTRLLDESKRHLSQLLARRLADKQAAALARARVDQAAALAEEKRKREDEARYLEKTGAAPAQVAAVRQEALHLAPPPLAKTVSTVAGKGTRDAWRANVTDLGALVMHIGRRLEQSDESLLALLSVNQTAANSLARALKGTLKVPGLEAINTPTLVTKKD